MSALSGHHRAQRDGRPTHAHDVRRTHHNTTYLSHATLISTSTIVYVVRVWCVCVGTHSFIRFVAAHTLTVQYTPRFIQHHTSYTGGSHYQTQPAPTPALKSQAQGTHIAGYTYTGSSAGIHRTSTSYIVHSARRCACRACRVVSLCAESTARTCTYLHLPAYIYIIYIQQIYFIDA